MKKILYLGDTHLRDAAAYLAGLMHHWGWDFDYVASDKKPAAAQWETSYGLFIFSDYPAPRLCDDDHREILSQVATGAGLVMIGGWESFHGLGGDWDGTAVGDALPVKIARKDDRRNCDQPVLLRRLGNHRITRDLPWEDRPPVIGGFNSAAAKHDAEVIVEACVLDAKCLPGADFQFQLEERHPLLVVGKHEQGRTACIMTDVAPHWVGPLVDWGEPRIAVQAPGSNEVEVGGHYATFFKQLLEWTAGEC